MIVLRTSQAHCESPVRLVTEAPLSLFLPRSLRLGRVMGVGQSICSSWTRIKEGFSGRTSFWKGPVEGEKSRQMVSNYLSPFLVGGVLDGWVFFLSAPGLE